MNKEFRNVYFLGAGVSLCAYSFSTSGLFEQALSALQYNDQSLYSLVVNVMNRIYPDFHPSLPWVNKNDIEDALDLIEAYDEFFGDFELAYKSKDYFKKAKKALIYGICWAFEPIFGIKDPKPLREFVRGLTPGDCIITLNWDTVTERLLYENHPENEILYCPNPYDNKIASKKITFIKLHGSLDWFYDPKGTNIPPNQKESFRIFGNSLWRTVNFQPITNRFSKAIPFIIPPQSKKNYDNCDIKKIWETAFWYLQNANKIYIIGTSVRNTDLNVRVLLQSSIKDGNAFDIIVVNPEECRSKNSLFRRFSINITNKFLYIETNFENWNFVKD